MSVFRHVNAYHVTAGLCGAFVGAIVSFIATHAIKANPPKDLIGSDGKLKKGAAAGRAIGIAFAFAVPATFISYFLLKKYAK